MIWSGGEGDLADAFSIVIWTTTPWTIPQNRAICFNPDLPYGLYRVTEAPEGNWAKTGRYSIFWPTGWPRTC